MVRSLSKIQQVFSTFFSDALSTWLLKEIELNKQRPLPKSQLEFWAAPPATAVSAFNMSLPHDPRGCPAYIRDYILPFQRLQDTLKPSTSPLAFWRGGRAAAGGAGGGRGGSNSASSSCSKGACSDEGAVVPRHRPHPNIVDSLFGVVRSVSTSPQEQAERLDAMSGVEQSEDVVADALVPGNGTVAGIADVEDGELDDEDQVEEDDLYNDFEKRVDDYAKVKKIIGDQ